MAPPLRIEIRIARRYAEIVRCQYLIAETYNRFYDVVFSRDMVDLHSKIEPYPHRYIMGLVNGELVAAAGLYTRDTYVERYGDVGTEEIARTLDEHGLDIKPDTVRREYTKLVVDQRFHKRGIGRFFFAATHSRDFLCSGMNDEPLLLACARLSMFERLYDVVGVSTRPIKRFPIYKVHENYASPTDPMDSRLIVPSLDIDPRWYGLRIPGVYEVTAFGGRE